MSLKDWLKFCAIGLIWGSTFLWIKIAIEEIGPYTLVLYRVIISILVLSGFMIHRKRLLTRAMLLPAFFLGLFNLLIPQALISWSEQFIPSWLASILVSAVPFFTAFLSLPFIPEERLNWRKGLGLLLGFLGVFVLVSGGMNGSSSANLLGSLAVVAAALCFAFSNVYTRVRAQHLSPEALSFWMLFPALFVVFPLALGVEGPLTLPTRPLTWIALLYLGALNGGAAMIFFYSLVQKVGPGRTSLVAYTYPLVGVMLAVIFLQEKPGWALALGGVLVISGILVFNRIKWRKSNGRNTI